MTLTLDRGPLSPHSPDTTNYRINGPAHKLLMHPFPRRIRARFSGRTVLDSTAAFLLHESAILPQLYVPEADLDTSILEPTEHSTHCPFKGDASYRSVVVGDEVAENAIWAYTEPTAEAPWLDGLVGVYWKSMDAWIDEDEEVAGHLRDPYHRVDARRSSRGVRVLLGEDPIAESESFVMLSETGLPNRFYLPADDVRTELLRRSEKTSVCPYKGDAEYWSLEVDDRTLTDAAFSYPRPLPDLPQIADQICLLHDELRIEIDGEPAEG